MSKYFHQDIEQENQEIADRLLAESQNIPIPEHQPLEELLSGTKKSIPEKKTPQKFRQNKKKMAALAACLLLLLGIGGMQFVKQAADNASRTEKASVSLAENATDDIPARMATDYDQIYKAFQNTVFAASFSQSGSHDIANESLSKNGLMDTSSATGMDYSTTNVQTDGIDEDDLAKTDGTYIYSVKQTDRKSIIYITKAEKTSTRTISSITVSRLPKKSSDAVTFHGIYLYDHYLAALYTRNQYDTKKDIQNINPFIQSSFSKTDDVLYPSKSTVIIKVYDIADRADPKLLHTNRQEGSYVSSRMKDAHLYTVTAKSADISEKVFDYPAAYNDEYTAFYYDETCIPEINGEKIPAKNIYLPNKIDVAGFSIATVLDVTDSSDFQNLVSVAGTCDQIYVSASNLYLINNYYDTVDLSEEENPFQNKKLKKGRLVEEDLRNLKKQIQDANPDISIENIKEEVYRRDIESVSFVNIVKYRYDKDRLSFVAENNFAGTAYNNLFFDEKEDYLRFVSSVEPEFHAGFQINLYDEKNRLLNSYYESRRYQDEPLTSQVTVLDGNLNRIALIDHLAKGETLYAARYLGDYGYFVTFEETDPLFCVDFSDIRNPKITAKLKLPGYSSYLGFYGSDLLLGFGAEDKDDRSLLKLEMYDVSNGNALRQAKRYVGKKDAYSPALYDYKALLTDAGKNLIGFYYDDDIGSGNEYVLQSYYALYSYKNKKFSRIANIPLKDCQSDNIKGLYIGHYFYVVDCDYGIYAFDLMKPEFYQTNEFSAPDK